MGGRKSLNTIADMARKPSKKSKCPCGSGLRYEKCCRKKFIALRKAKALFQQQDKARAKFAEKYGQIRIPQLVHTQNGAYATVGGGIYKQTRRGPYSFLNLVHDHALLFFGEPYLEEQEQLPMTARHPALQWMHTFVDIGSERGAAPIGAGAAWYRFAFDLFTIRDNSTLTAEIRERLLDIGRFQSARHELWVAALFVAAGFDINFEDESDNRGKHPEFVAVDRGSGTRIAVEAKSRHRKGVKSFDKGKEYSSVGVRNLVLDAYRKVSDLPFYVFVDVNLPPAREEVYRGWINEIHKLMTDLEDEGYADPSPANIVFFHNDPSHFMLAEDIGMDRDKLWIANYFAHTPQIPHPVIDVLAAVSIAHDQRVAPPDELPAY